MTLEHVVDLITHLREDGPFIPVNGIEPVTVNSKEFGITGGFVVRRIVPLPIEIAVKALENPSKFKAAKFRALFMVVLPTLGAS